MVLPRLTPRNLAGTLANSLVDVVYPKRCAGCGARGDWVCRLCLDDLPLFTQPWCSRCGIPESSGPCKCLDVPWEIMAVRALGPHAGWLRAAIIALKYEDEPGRAAHLGGLLAPLIDSLGRDLVLCAVPLHRSRERERGYNQSLLLARHAARPLDLPVLPLLRRTRDTAHQVGLDAAGRQANVDGAFDADPREVSRHRVGHVVLVDDVMTSGSTIAACASALRNAGVGRIDAATLARAI